MTRSSSLGTLFTVVLVGFAFGGCAPGSAPSGLSGCTPGEAMCECATGARCLTGLACSDGLCLPPGAPGADGGVDTGSALTPDWEDPADRPPPTTPDPEAFWAMDPPPMQCLADGSSGPAPSPPGGTPECPDDKNREGCRCETAGATAPCWPGLRANRDRGICQDGVTTCQPFDEFGGVWGACQGAVLPVDGAARGPSACACFSAGRWEIDNLSPCFIDYGTSGVFAVSTYVGSDGWAACPDLPSDATPPPRPQAGEMWSDNRLTVDCEGSFELCYTLKAGDADAPSAADCTVARVCTGSIWYADRDVTQELPPLGGWTSSDSTCARRFRDVGGYGEMTVRGRSVECDAIDDGAGGEYVFSRVPYCPLSCNDDPTATGCESCSMGGAGSF